MIKTSYSKAIYDGFDYLLENYPEVFILGQGLWSPWYVGNTMNNLETRFGKQRIIDTPVSESACTGAAVGASLCGMKPVIVHPRMDFMLYSMDAIVNQAAKWSYMFGGKSNASVTVRAIINRGGCQGAQHSQSLHSWFAHIPGLRVVMPSTVQDARDILIASVLCPDPVIYIDDRWLYDQEDYLEPIIEKEIDFFQPKYIDKGNDITIVGNSYSTFLGKQLKNLLSEREGISAELIDLRTINPLKIDIIINSVKKTRRLLVIDGGWKPCGLSSEIIASVIEKLPINTLKYSPKRITLPNCPAPSSPIHEKIYYPDVNYIFSETLNFFKS
tara:strand:+ start:14089 stop:15075 length:987 start_codon:yes stop_codon:yes gene_type:complete